MLATLLCITGLLVCGPAAAPAVAESTGVFLLQRAHSRVWVPGTPRAPLFANDWVRTPPDGVADLTLLDGTVMRLAPATAVRVLLSRSGQRGGQPNLTIQQASGATRLAARSPLRLKTTLVTAGVRGTEFRVQVLSGARNLIATDAGGVQVEMAEQQVLVNAGNEVEARHWERLDVRAQRLSPPRLAPPRWTEAGLAVSGVTEPRASVEVTVDGVAAGRACPTKEIPA